MSEPETPDAGEQEPVWLEITNELQPNAQRYVCVMTIDGALRVPLTAQVGTAWATGLLGVATEARNQVAVMEQALAIGAEDIDAAPDLGAAPDPVALRAGVQAIQRLRAKMPPAPRLGPIEARPEMSAVTRSPWVALYQRGEAVAQWSPAEAEEHALAVLAALRTASMDTTYLRWLTSEVKVDLPRASQMVGHLGLHQERVCAATSLRLPQVGPDREQRG